MLRGPTNRVAGPAGGDWTTDLCLVSLVKTTPWTRKHEMGRLHGGTTSTVAASQIFAQTSKWMFVQRSAWAKVGSRSNPDKPLAEDMIQSAAAARHGCAAPASEEATSSTVTWLKSSRETTGSASQHGKRTASQHHLLVCLGTSSRGDTAHESFMSLVAATGQ